MNIIKAISLFCYLCYPMFVSSQMQGSVNYDFTINIENLGKDNNGLLNEDESKFLNNVFFEKKGNFDFAGKKCFYLGGSGGGVIKEKSYFFRIANPYNSNWEKGCQLIILNEEESSFYGYDVIIVVWSKRIVSKKYALRKIRKYLAKK